MRNQRPSVLPPSPRLASFALLLLALLCAGCASPVAVRDGDPPELRQLADLYTRTVQETARDPRFEWVYGWDGNDRIAEEGNERLRGLCYEWQELIYRAIRPEAKRLGWKASMIAVNENWFSEHHAVLVHDPDRGDSGEVLARREEEAWVFDPWISGRPEVYRLRSWLAIPWIVFNPARIEPDEP